MVTVAHIASRAAAPRFCYSKSDKPRADYSVPAFANGMRDLLVVLGIPKVTVVGHSLGGGVAMQFCYQFPRFVERLVLVAAGIIGAIATMASYIAAVDMAGAAARSHAIGVEYQPAREDARVNVQESAGLIRASVSVDAPIGTMSAEAVFPAEVAGND